MPFRFIVLLCSLTACTGLTTIEPVAYQVPRTGQNLDLIVANDVPAYPGLPVVYGYPVFEPQAVVVLVHGLGTNAAIWDLPETGRLARRVWRAGYAVYTLDLNFTDGEDSLGATRQHLSDVLTALSRRHRGQKVIGIGHDIGGTLLYQLLYDAQPRLDGVIGIGAQVGFGGYSKALLALFSAAKSAPSITWPMLDNLELSKALHTDIRVSELLLSSSLSEKARFTFYNQALSRMPSSVLNEIYLLGSKHPVPVLDPLIASTKAQIDLPVLAIMAPSDGLAPPWQCDPKVFGMRQKLTRSVYLTRANGESMEYNHLDMLLHPVASREVFPLVMDWLEEQVH